MRSWIGLIVALGLVVVLYSLFRNNEIDQPAESQNESSTVAKDTSAPTVTETAPQATTDRVAESLPRDRVNTDSTGDKTAPTDLPRAIGARIEGRVLDRSGRPMGGATVRLLGSDGALLRVDRDLGFSVQSDSDGRFVFADPPAVLGLSIEANANGFASLRRDIGIVEAGSIVGPIELILEAEITLRGTVRDPDGRPLAGVALELSVAEGAPGTLANAIATARTNDAGSYEVRGLRRQLYRVLASKEGFVPQLQQKTLFAVTLKPESTLDLMLEPAVASVKGRVLDDADTPIPGATVTAVSEPHVVRTTTSSTGEFELKGLGRGSYHATAQSGGFHPSAARDIHGGEQDVVLRVARGGSLRGRLAVRGGAVLDSAAVDLVLLERASGRFSLVSRALFDRGTFRAEGLAPGTYKLVITSLTARRTESAPFELQPGSDLDLGTIECPRGGSVSGRIQGSGLTAEGTVALLLGDLDASNPAARGAALFSQETQKTTYRAGTPFRLENVAPGEYSLLILPTKGAPRTVRGIRVEDEATTSLVDVEFASGGSVFGRVLDVQGSSIVAETIRATQENGKVLTTTSDSDGYFTFVDLEAGQVTVSLDASPRLRGAARPVTTSVESGDAKEIELRVRPEGS